jgi:hypothetical protein
MLAALKVWLEHGITFACVIALVATERTDVALVGCCGPAEAHVRRHLPARIRPLALTEVRRADPTVARSDYPIGPSSSLITPERSCRAVLPSPRKEEPCMTAIVRGFRSARRCKVSSVYGV